jgi:hypothetical protein
VDRRQFSGLRGEQRSNRCDDQGCYLTDEKETQDRESEVTPQQRELQHAFHRTGEQINPRERLNYKQETIGIYGG